MNVQVLKFALPVLVVAFALPVFAVDVSFTSTGSFSGPAASCGADCVVLSDGNNATAVDLSATTIGLTSAELGPELDVTAATFKTTATGSRFDGPVPTGETFTLAITQTDPGAASGSFTADLSGTVIFNSSGDPEINFCGAAATCAPPTIVLDHITYQLLPTEAVDLALPSGAGPAGAGVTNIEMAVTPEPTFMMLTGLGFAGLALVAYRRRRAV
jgi:hypothetical protein